MKEDDSLPLPGVSSGRRKAQESSADEADPREGERAHRSRGNFFGNQGAVVVGAR